MVTVVTTATEEEAEIDEKCMFAVDAKQLSQHLRQVYGHLVMQIQLEMWANSI